jgi:peptidoglycan-associated lipoprotein
MISKKLLTLVVAAVFATGCTCKPHQRLGADSDNIPNQEEGPLTDVHYAFDSYALDNTAKGIIKSNAEWLKSNPSSKVQVEGHCDERGTNEYNMALGAKRARASMEALRSQGIEASRMSTVSYGEEMPKDPAHNESAWAKNRRAHFKVQN